MERECGICGKTGYGFKPVDVLPHMNWFACQDCERQCAEDAAKLAVPRSKEVH